MPVSCPHTWFPKGTTVRGQVLKVRATITSWPLRVCKNCGLIEMGEPGIAALEGNYMIGEPSLGDSPMISVSGLA